MLKNISRDDVDEDDLAVLVLDAFKKYSKYEASWQKFQTGNEKKSSIVVIFSHTFIFSFKPQNSKKSVREQT